MERKTNYTRMVMLAGLLSFAGVSYQNYANAQTGSNGGGGRNSRQNSGGRTGTNLSGRMDSMGGSFGGTTIAAGGDYVYILRGSTLYQLRSNDLSLVKQQMLPLDSAVDGARGSVGGRPSGGTSSDTGGSTDRNDGGSGGTSGGTGGGRTP